MLFEKFVRLDTGRLIRLSQARADEAPDYPEEFEKLFQDILRNPECVEKPPLFFWGGVFSTCWRLERGRAHQGEVGRLLAEAEEADGKGKYALLQKAEKSARLVCQNITEWTQRLESTRIPLLHPRFALAQLLRVRAKRFRAAWKVVSEQETSDNPEKQNKMRRLSSLRAFQAYELAHQLWRVGSDPLDLKSFEEAAHFEIARASQEMQETLNHAFQAQSFSDFWATVQAKNEVWRLDPQAAPLHLHTVQEFLDIYSSETS